MKRVSIIFLFILSGCKDQAFTKTASGMEYRIMHSGYGDYPRQGDFLKLQVKQVFGDTLLMDTRKTLPQYQAYDTAQMSKESCEIFSHVRSGDSIVFRVPSDSAFKTSKPSFVKKHDWLTTYVKVQAILHGEAEMKADYELEKAKRYPVPTTEAGSSLKKR